MRRPCSARARSSPRASAACVLLVVAGWALWSPTPALAHTSLLGSTPAPSASVSAPLESVTLEFSQAVSPRQARIVVSGPDGVDLADGPVRVSGGTVTRAVGAQPTAGDYRLAYRVLAEDGHPITGQVQFRLTSSAVQAGNVQAGGVQAGGVQGGAVPPAAQPTGAATPGVPQQQPVPALATSSRGTGPASLVPALVAGLVGVGVVLVLGAVFAGRRAGAAR